MWKSYFCDSAQKVTDFLNSPEIETVQSSTIKIVFTGNWFVIIYYKR